MPKSFRDLEVWRHSMELATLIYELTAGFPKHETYGLSSQMRRSAVSIPSNVAEGSARATRRDFRQFVLIARGSNAELQTQLMIAGNLGYAERTKIDHVLHECQKVGRMLHGLSSFLKSKPVSPSSPPTI